MNVSKSVPVDVPADRLFAFVSDIERVAPCLPGARIDGRDGDDYLGSMKVKVGPLVVSYKGTLRFDELDSDARRAVMIAEADEVSGSGAANARIVTSIEPAEAGSLMHLDTDLDVRGRAAQFGQGTIQKISERLIKQFAGNIEKQAGAAAQPEPAGVAGATAAETGTTPPVSDGAAPPRPPSVQPPAETELNALELLLGSEGKRWATLGLAGFAGLLLGYLLGRSRSRG